MDELPVTDIYPDMTLSATGFEKNQVAKFQGFFCDGFAGFGKLFSGSRYFFIKYITKGYVYKPGAVDTCFTETAQFIRRAFPARVVFG